MSFGKTINLGNSIIGVSILAMPYCFVQSGLVLSILLIIFSGFLTRLSCHLLLKSALLSRQTSFELMVQDVLGATGRFLVEIGLIGFLLGTCVAYFIMIGDLAPKIMIELFGIKDYGNLRLVTIIALSIFVALPLSLLKKIDSLTSLSILSMILYSCLVIKLLSETTDKFEPEKMSQNNLSQISYWNTAGLLTTFPIFSMAMSCQTSLFEIFDNSVSNCDLETLKRDNNIIKKAIYMCSMVYIIVGLLGYMAFHDQTLYGNILLAFPPSLTTTLTKFGFIVSLLLSFPLCLFPCRTSVYSLTVGKIRELMKLQRVAAAEAKLAASGGRVDGSTTLTDQAVASHSDRIDIFDDSNNNNNSSGGGGNNNINNQKDICLKQLNLEFSTSNGKYNHNLTSQPGGNKGHDSNQIQLNTIINSNGSPYAYTKLLSDDDDELALDHEFDLKGAYDEETSSTNDLILTQSPTKIYMSDFHFRLLTVILIIITVMLSLLFPHIEFILGIIGSTAGTTVCFVLPAYTFIKIGKHSKMELYSARLLLTLGLAMFVFCSYSTIHKAGELETDN